MDDGRRDRAGSAVYLSSTYIDLKGYRRAVIDALRQIDVRVVGMEDYSADDSRPLQRCLEDVDGVDFYIGLFAWKYGFVPPEGNPSAKSITELEYRRAQSGGKPCLIFLLDAEEPWPPALVDRGPAGERIAALRADASSRHLVKFFRRPEDLVNSVLAAVHNHLAKRPPERAEAPPAKGETARELDDALRTTGLTRSLLGHSDAVECVALLGPKGLAASGSWDKSVRVWDLNSGRQLCRLSGHTGSLSRPGIVSGVALRTDGSQVVSCGFDGSIRLWSVASGREVRRLSGHEGAVTAIALTADSRRLVSTGADRSLRVWDLDELYEVRRMTGHDGQPRSVAISADGKLAVSGGTDQGLRVWDLEHWQQRARLERPTNPINSVDVSADGELALTADIDGAIQLWELSTGAEVRRFEGHQGSVRRALMSADLRRVLSGGNDTTMRLWDLSSGEELRRFSEHGAPVVTLAISADGRHAVSGGANGAVYVWGLP